MSQTWLSRLSFRWKPVWNWWIPFGNTIWIGKSTISMAIFNTYVKLCWITRGYPMRQTQISVSSLSRTTVPSTEGFQWCWRCSAPNWREVRGFALSRNMSWWRSEPGQFQKRWSFGVKKWKTLSAGKNHPQVISHFLVGGIFTIPKCVFFLALGCPHCTTQLIFLTTLEGLFQRFLTPLSQVGV